MKTGIISFIIILVWSVVNYIMIVSAVLIDRHFDFKDGEHPAIGIATFVFVVGTGIAAGYLIEHYKKRKNY